MEQGNFSKINKIFLWLYEGKHNKGFDVTTHFQSNLISCQTNNFVIDSE